MNLSLTPQLGAFVGKSAESGDYNNASEVVREVLRLFKRATQERTTKLAHLRSALAEGEAAISRGESHVFNSAQELDHFFEQL
ncbi:MAG TPA: type II toxin-antitoxin system ParD family antitoxin [Oceanospirillaceae bacterium]|nr:type II toxin-antitoxin system ParD family antitoxin [Oceanospirillaceae bacterium]